MFWKIKFLYIAIYTKESDIHFEIKKKNNNLTGYSN